MNSVMKTIKNKKYIIFSKSFLLYILKLKFLEKYFIFPRIIAIKLIKLYRYFLSPIFPATCRFYPTCSYYAEKSFQKFGFWKGLYFTIRRILKCNPFNPGGFDPVYQSESSYYKNFEKNNYKN